MTTRIQDQNDLSVVSPVALAAYARTQGWTKTDTFGSHSDVYIGNGLPEILVPRTKNIGDYRLVVAQLVGIFASVADISEVALYDNLITTDRDVIRVRVEGDDNTVDINEGASLVSGARDMLLAAACSLDNTRALYRAGANREAVEYLSQVRLGQTEPGSFVVTLLPPVIVPPLQRSSREGADDIDPPIARRMTKRLHDALHATQQASERTVSGDNDAFADAVSFGVSANLCDALVQMIKPFPALDIRLTWARTRPLTVAQHPFRFTQDEVPMLSEASRVFRNREPKPDVQLLCSVQRLQRDESETDGTVTLRTSIEGAIQSVVAVLSQSDYNKAIDAHRGKQPIIAEGDLERAGQRWRLLNPQVVAVITDDEAEDD